MLLVNFPAHHLGDKIPLLRGIAQTNGTALCNANSMLYEFYARVLFIVEPSVETIVEHKEINSLSFKVFAVIQFQRLLTIGSQCAETGKSARK